MARWCATTCSPLFILGGIVDYPASVQMTLALAVVLLAWTGWVLWRYRPVEGERETRESLQRDCQVLRWTTIVNVLFLLGTSALGRV